MSLHLFKPSVGGKVLFMWKRSSAKHTSHDTDNLGPPSWALYGQTIFASDSCLELRNRRPQEKEHQTSKLFPVNITRCFTRGPCDATHPQIVDPLFVVHPNPPQPTHLVMFSIALPVERGPVPTWQDYIEGSVEMSKEGGRVSCFLRIKKIFIKKTKLIIHSTGLLGGRWTSVLLPQNRQNHCDCVSFHRQYLLLHETPH